MSEVRKWLEAIDLAQYADAFVANDLDIDLLGQVDDQVLKDIGVSSAGHRLRIRNAIAKLGTQVKNESAHGPLTAAGETSAERRQVTVMFSDLVGSTALSAHARGVEPSPVVGRAIAQHRGRLLDRSVRVRTDTPGGGHKELPRNPARRLGRPVWR